MNLMEFKVYTIGKQPEFKQKEISDELYEKYLILKGISCMFEIEYLSTGAIHMDVIYQGDQLCNELLFGATSSRVIDITIENLINKAYNQLFNNNKEGEKEVIKISNKNIKDMTFSDIEKYIKELENDVTANNYEFQSQKNELIGDFLDDIQDVVASEFEIALPIKFFVAGGAILSTFTKQPINDFDLYFYTESDFNKFKKAIEDTATKYLETEKSITYNRSGQIFQLCKQFGTPQDIFNKFDFTVCMAALPIEIDEKETIYGDFIFSETFLSDVMSKSLVFNPKTLYPINSLVRLKKYLNKGYEINSVNMMKMALAVNTLPIKTVKDLKEQIAGVSNEVSETITNYLSKYKDDDIIDNSLEFFQKAVAY